MAVSMTQGEVAAVVSGELRSDGSRSFSGVEFDTRRIIPGQLFIALPGEVTHGHAFLEQAFAAGAELALVEDNALLENPVFGDRLVAVSNSLEAFWTLARHWRGELGAKVFGVTGSMGKTTTKELLRALLESRSEGTYSKKSFNNHLGLPYTLCNASKSDEWVVLEMGMNHAGELLELSRLARPDVALITCIAPVHIEFFKDLEAIADAKLEIAVGVPETGTMILNGDDEVLLAAWERFQEEADTAIAQTLLFGKDPEADVVLVSAESHGFNGIDTEIEIASDKFRVHLPLLGMHNATLFSGALAAAGILYPDLRESEVKEAMGKFEPPAMRLNIRELAGSRYLIDDSYNSNPRALQASLEMLAGLKAEGKTVGVLLGDMRELGDKSEHYHREAGAQVGHLKPSFLVTVGEASRWLSDAAAKTGVKSLHAGTPEDGASLVAAESFDILLVKASRGVELDRSVRKLLERFGKPTSA